MKITPQNSMSLRTGNQVNQQQSKSQIFISNKLLANTRQSTKLTNRVNNIATNSQNKIKQAKQQNIVQMSSTNLAEYFCNICHLFKNKDEMVAFSDCFHVFCYDCTLAYVMARIQQNLPLNCCQQSCPLVLNTQSNSTAPNNMILFIKKIPKQQKKQISNYLKRNRRLFKKCQTCTFKNDDRKQIVQKCEQCKKDQIELPEGHKKCRNCWKILEKQKGCDHVKCPCGFQFCFNCEEEWKTNHICQHRIPQRSGCGYVTCLILKIPIYVILAIPLLALFIVFSIFICLISASLLGVFTYFKLIQALAKLQGIGNCLKFILFLLSLITFPIIVAVCIVPGFLIPLINLFYKESIFLNPKIMQQLAQGMFGCILMLRLL